MEIILFIAIAYHTSHVDNMNGKLLAASAMATTAMAMAVTPMSDAVKAKACSPAFKNIVFNSGVNEQPDIVGRLETIRSYGVDKWSMHAMIPLEKPDE